MTTNHRLSSLLETKRPWITDGGLETDMLFNHGVDLPSFASFTMLEDPSKRELLKRYFAEYIAIASEARAGFILDTCTWRANAPWIERMGLTTDDLERVNKDAVDFCNQIRSQHETPDSPILINGVVGPAGDGYAIDQAMTIEQAEQAHAPQVRVLAEAGADVISAITMNYAEEAIGVAVAAARANMPCVISFTVETDGNLPSGQPLGDAIAQTDAKVEELTGAKPTYYMINCAHPDHFSDRLTGTDEWKTRIGGVRANASRLSHAELDEAEELDDGDPTEFGALYGDLATHLPALKVIGGCCGTDLRHVGCAARVLHS